MTVAAPFQTTTAERNFNFSHLHAVLRVPVLTAEMTEVVFFVTQEMGKHHL